MCKVKTNLPLLSIRLMVFNHADFLEECLNSINEQKTNFKFELVIGDDFSEDNSFEILKNFSFSNTNISCRSLHIHAVMPAWQCTLSPHIRAVTPAWQYA